METKIEAIEQAKRLARGCNTDFVVTENKHNVKSRKTWFGIQSLVNQDISGEWYNDRYGTYSRIVEVVRA